MGTLRPKIKEWGGKRGEKGKTAKWGATINNFITD
jgi:hypothetical protein